VGAVGIHLYRRGIVLDVDFELRNAPNLPQGVEGTIDGDAMRPRPEL
jgi:hypothetical protein